MAQYAFRNYDHKTTGCAKNDPTCFCQNFVKSPPNFRIFGTQRAKTMEICKVHSLSTLPSLC